MSLFSQDYINDLAQLGTVEAAATVLAVLAFSKLIQWKRIFSRRLELQRWIARAREERASKHFPILDGEDPLKDTDILSLSAIEIAERIRSGAFQVTDVVTTFAKRCRQYGRNERQINAITEELYDTAYAQAQALSTSNKDGLPLCGIPISVKECLAIEGCYSTGGLACRLKARMTEDCLVVKILKNAGAVPVCLGNTIQTMMLLESVNNIWGRSRNPWDLSRTPSGSSGGDAALVAARCVPLAVGSDVAGSIRLPASSCGIVGFKPTSTRISWKGCMFPCKDDRSGTNTAIPCVIGPLARTVDDCAMFMKSVCVPELWNTDLNMAPVPFRTDIYEKQGKLTIGYFETDDWFQPCQTTTRALKETIAKLSAAGHKCIPFDIPTNGSAHFSLVIKMNTAEGNMRSYFESLEGEELRPEFAILKMAALMPDMLRWFLRKFIDKRRAFLLGCSRRHGVSVYDVWQILADISDMKDKWSQAFTQTGVDAVIYPALPLPALLHGVPGKLTPAASYMFIANILQWPCGAVPITTVQPGEDNYDFADLPSDQRDEFADQAATVMKDSVGLPIGVNVMSSLFQDETCLRVMKEIERVTNFTAQPKAFKEDTTS